MVIKTFSELCNFLPKLSILFTKIVFKGTAARNREKHMLKPRNQNTVTGKFGPSEFGPKYKLLNKLRIRSIKCMTYVFYKLKHT